MGHPVSRTVQCSVMDCPIRQVSILLLCNIDTNMFDKPSVKAGHAVQCFLVTPLLLLLLLMLLLVVVHVLFVAASAFTILQTHATYS